MWRRMHEALSPFEHEILMSDIPILLSESSAGQSLIYSWIATVLATISGFLWISVYHTLKRNIKVLEGQSSGAYNYNVCCTNTM